MKSKLQISNLNLKNRLLLLVVIFFSFSSLGAQWLVQSHYVTRNINACDTTGEAWHVKAIATGVNTGNSFVITFPTGIKFASLQNITTVGIAASGVSTSAAVGATSVTITVPNMVLNNVVEFDIYRTADCTAIAFNSGGGSFVDNLAISYNGGSLFAHASNDATFGNGAYAINTPNIIVNSVIGAPATANIGDIVIHTITVKNEGQNSTINNFHVNLNYTDFILDVTSVPANGVLNTAGNRIDFTNLAALGGQLADGKFNEGDSYTFTLKGKLKKCTAVASYSSGFTCGTATSCNSFASIAVNTTINTGFPNVVTTVVPNQGAAIGCNPKGSVTYTFTNNGTNGATAGSGYASNVSVMLGSYRSNSTGNAIANTSGAFDNNTIGIAAELTEVFANGIALPASLVTITNGRIHVRFNELQDATLAGTLGLIDADGDTFYDDLPVGGVITLTSTQSVACTTQTYGQHAARMLYNNQCETNLKVSWTAAGTELARTTNGATGTGVAPSNITGGVPFNVGFEGGTVVLNPAAYTGCANQYMELKITFSQAMDFTSMTIGDIYNRANTFTVDATNKILTIKVPLMAGSTQYLNGLSLKNLKYPCGTNSTVNATYQWKYKCEDCATCEIIFFSGPLFSFGTQGCTSTPCDGASTTSITAQRTTFGWATQADFKAGLPALTNGAGLQTDYLLMKDRLNVVAAGKINGGTFAVAGMKISYTNTHTFSFENGTATLKDASTGIIYTGVVNTPILSTATGVKIIDIPTSAITFTPALPAGFTYQSNDELNFNLNLILDYSPNSAHENIPLFRTAHYGVESISGNKLNCEDYGTSFRTRNVNYSSFAIPISSLSNIFGCSILQGIGLVITPTGSGNTNWGINEFRPYAQITKMEFNIPAGFKYVPGSAKIRYYDKGLKTVSIQDPDPAQLALGKVSLTQTSAWPLSNFEIATSCCYGYSVYVDLAPTCAAQAVSTQRINVTGNYVKDLYSQTSSPITGIAVSGNTNPYNYTPPSITHNNPATVTVLSKLINWSVNYTNNNSVLGSTWLKITSPTGKTKLEKVMQGATSLPIIADAGTPNTWFVNTAGFNATTTETYVVTASYTSCVADELIVDFGYDCVSQPTTFTGYTAAACSLNPFPLKYIPAPALVQISTVTPAPLNKDLCTPFTLDFDIKSADLASLYDMVLKVDLAPFNSVNNEYPMSYVSGSTEISFNNGVTWLPAGAANPGYATQGANTQSFTLDLTAVSNAVSGGLATNGLEGGTNLRVRFQLTTTCSHVSGTGPQVTINANKPCGEVSPGNGANANAPVFAINGVTVPYITSILMTGVSPLLYYTGNSSAVTAEVTMVGGTSQATDQIVILIPNKLIYAGGTVDVDSDGDGTYDTTVTPTATANTNGSTTLNFTAVGGVTSGNKFGYRFNVSPGTSAFTCGEIQKVTLSYNSPVSLSCGPVACPNSFVSAGNANTNIVLQGYPNVQISGALVFCQGGSSVLTASATGTGNTFSWSNGSTTATTTVTTAGTYTVTVTTAAGCIDTKSAIVQVDTPPNGQNASLAICSSASTGVFDLTTAQPSITTTAGTTFSYYINQADANAGNANIIVNPTNYTSANATIYVLIKKGTCSQVVQLMLTVTQTIVPTITASSTVICGSGSVTLTSNFATGNIWSTGETTQTISMSTAGTYTLTYTVSSCTSTPANIVITKNDDPNVQITGNLAFCAGTSTTLTATANGTGNTFLWSNTATTAATTVTTPGTYTVTVTTAGGCPFTKTVTVTQNPVPTTTNATLSKCSLTANADFNLTSAQTAISTSSGITFSYYTNLADATAGAANFIVNPAVYNSPTATIYVRVSNANCFKVAELQLTVVETPTPVITQSAPAICAGTPVVLTSNYSTGNVWSTGATTQSITVTTGGAYSLIVNNGNCPSASVSVTIVENANPNVQISGVLSFCQGSSTTLTATSTGNGNTYLWSTGTTSAATTVNAAGTYTVTVTTAAGCPFTKTVTVTQEPIITINIAQPGQVNCIIPTVTLNATTSVFQAGSTILWTAAGGGNIVSGANTLTPIVSGGGNYTLTITNTTGLLCSQQSTITVVQSTFPPVITVTAPKTTICDGETLVLTLNGAQTYNINGAPITGTTFAITPNTTTTYTVNGVDVNGCQGNTATIIITVVPAIVSTLDDIQFCRGLSGVLDAGVGLNYIYLWDTGATTQTITVDTPGVYNVTINNGTCNKTFSATVSYTPVPVMDEVTYENTTLMINIKQPIPPNLEYSINGGIDWQASNIFTNVIPNLNYSILVRVKRESCFSTTEFYAFFVQNVMTPNSDGINDYIDFTGVSQYKNFKASIYDRYGKEVFRATPKNPIWNGNFIKLNLPTATYWYQVSWLDPISNKPILRNGWILLKNKD